MYRVVDTKVGPFSFELDELVAPCVTTALEPYKQIAITNLVAQLKCELGPFPKSCCEVAASRVEQLDFGLEYINGIFAIGRNGGTHACNVDRKSRLYIDITAAPFNNSLPEVLIISVGSSLATSHYFEDYYAAW